VNPFSNYLDRLGSNFLVAAMIPSLGLVIACLVVFEPILKISDAFQIDNGIYSLIGISLLLAVPTVLVGFTLTAMNTFLLKFFEGYVFFHRIPFMRNAQRKKARQLLAQRETLRNEIESLEAKEDKTIGDIHRVMKLKQEYRSVVINYDRNYPPPYIDPMPTEFGNKLKASEAYSGNRYGIDAVQFWPHLMHVVPQSYRQSIDGARNELSFLVNMSALSIVFYSLCILAILSTAPSPGSSPDWIHLFDQAARYILAGGIALLLNIFFNRAASFSVVDYGMMVRSAFDLFRLDLLEQFHLQPPQDSVSEYKLWRNLGELISLGQESLDFNPIQYHFKNKQ
jgi:hypothetical protein